MPKHDFTMPAAELARSLARQAEAVCRHYLPAGRRQGCYWLVGDVHNRRGRSLFVRLSGGAGKGAGRWQDSAEGTHGDLLDLIRERCGFTDFRDVAEEARRFLSRAGDAHAAGASSDRGRPAAIGGADPKVLGPNGADTAAAGPDPEAIRSIQAQITAQRLFNIAQPLLGTLAEAYLRRRGITSGVLADLGSAALRFHPRCFYRVTPDAPPETRPALIAAVTDLSGTLTGVQRTWLDPGGFDPIRLGKAPVQTPRRALGHLLGHAVRFGPAEQPTSAKAGVLAAGEGIETVLSLRCVMPAMPMAAALSAGHLAALLLPTGLRRLYIIRDADPVGDRAVAGLTERARAAGIEAITLSPCQGDFNDDLRELGTAELRANLRGQIAPEDVARFRVFD